MKALDETYTCISHGHVATYVNISQRRAQLTCSTRWHCSISLHDDVKTISQRKRSLPLPGSNNMILLIEVIFTDIGANITLKRVDVTSTVNG